MRLFALVLLATTAVAAPYRDQSGPFDIATIDSLDLERGNQRALAMRITYPKAKGPFPVIVFSHGMYGSKDGYAALATYWASFGYVVIQPTHPDSLKYGVQRAPTQAWEARPKEITLVIDSLGKIEAQSKALQGKLDRDRVAVGGHSFGAHTSQLVGGATAYTRVVGGGKSYLDERAKCVLLISPQGKGGVLREQSWRTLDKPALIVTGSNDKGRKGEPAEWRLDPFKHAPPGDRYLVWIDGAHHGFGGISGAKWRGAGPKNDDHMWVVRQVSLAFFDAFVKGDEKAKAWLRAGEIAKTDRAKVRCENRVPTARPAPSDRR